MKFLIVVCVAFTAVISANDEKKLPPAVEAKSKSYIEQCLNEQKLTLDDVAGLNKGDFSNKANDLQCFVNCYLQKFGLFVDGVIKEDAITELLTPIVGEEKLKGVMKKCDSLKGANECETAFKLYECYYSEHAASM